ncbi:unnamed protein product, partial [Medioppia subpectinata]
MSDKRVLLGSLRTKNVIIREMMSEFIGTFILVNSVGIATGVGLMIAAYLGAKVSGKLEGNVVTGIPSKGYSDSLSLPCSLNLISLPCYFPVQGTGNPRGHVNPVVTLAVATLGKFPWRKVPHYFVAQYLGGLVASILVYLNFYNAINDFDGGVRSAFFNATSTAGLMTTHPTLYLTAWGALCDQL